VLKQSYQDIQVIVVNDGSTDKSLEICGNFTDRRIKLIDRRHQGVSHARNIGIENATGEYICFVDADDCFNDEYALNDLLHCPANLVIEGFSRDYLDKDDIRYYAREYLLRPNKSTEFAYVWGKLFRREIIEENRLRFKVFMDKHEDTEFVFNYLYYCKDAFITGKSVYKHHYPVKGAGMKMIDSRLSCEALLHTISLLGFSGSLINHARVSLKIIEIIRAYRAKFMQHYLFAVGLLDIPLVRKSLKDYAYIPGNSQLISLLIKVRFYLILTLFCRIRGRRRYA